MGYENRQVPEGINVSHEHPLKEFFALLVGLIVIIAGIVIVLAMLAEYLAPFIPFSMEQKLAGKMDFEWQEIKRPTDRDKKVQHYLQRLGTNLAAQMDLPEDMQVNIQYSKDKTVNAYATLGGNIVVFRGMLRLLPHENAVAMILAHEIAHIKLRHPIVAAGRGITVSLALASITGLSNNSMIAGLINRIGLTSTLGFSRRQESKADKQALRALQKHYGHVSGAAVLFEVFKQQSAAEPPAFLSTHPVTKRRIELVEDFARQHTVDGKITALPDYLRFD